MADPGDLYDNALKQHVTFAAIGKEYKDVLSDVKRGSIDSAMTTKLMNQWIRSPYAQFDLPGQPSESMLRFITFVASMANCPFQAIDRENIDLHSLMKFGVLTEDTCEIEELSVQKIVEVVSFMCDSWNDIARVKGVALLIYAILRRFAVLSSFTHPVTLFDDGRFSVEHKGVEKRFMAEDKEWKRRQQRKTMDLCSKEELEREEDDRAQLHDWREVRTKQPKLDLLSMYEPLFRDMLAQLDFLQVEDRFDDSDDGPFTSFCATLREMSLDTLRKCEMRSVYQRRSAFVYTKRLCPGDIEKYLRQCPRLEPDPKAILSLYHSMRVAIPEEGYAETLRLETDDCSVLTVVERLIQPEKLKITPTHAHWDKAESSNDVSLRFVAGSLALITSSQCYFGDPNSIVAHYLIMSKHPIVDTIKARCDADLEDDCAGGAGESVSGDSNDEEEEEDVAVVV